MKNIILEIKNLIGAHTETELVNQMTDLKQQKETDTEDRRDWDILKSSYLIKKSHERQRNIHVIKISKEKNKNQTMVKYCVK